MSEVPKIISPVLKKRVESVSSIMEHPGEIERASFLHSILCQTFLPYKDPKGEKEYLRSHGKALLLLEAGKLHNPKTNEFDLFGLPYGAKARLVLAYINTVAIKTQNPVVPVERSLTAFVRRLGLDTGGKTIITVKEQVKRLAASTLRIGYSDSEDVSTTTKLNIISGIELWFKRSEEQHTLWPGCIKLSNEFFESLCEHAIPLDERALAALSNNSYALDVYCWLAQRLHRVSREKPQFISWVALKDQFGTNYKDIKKFREKFRETIRLVLTIYQDAKVEDLGIKGIFLRNSPPPIPYHNLKITI